MEILIKLRLKYLIEVIGNCQKCPKLCENRDKIVFGNGNFEKKILIVGQCPGFEESKTGFPFIGKAGQLLTQWLEHVGIDREEDVFITNLIQCRPPNNRNPEENEISECSQFLDKKIEFLKPKVILSLGKFASCYLSGKPKATMGYLRDIKLQYKNIPLVSTFHPSYILRKEGKFDLLGEETQKVIEDLTKLKEYL